MRAVLPDINKVGISEPCGGNRPSCQLYSSMKNTYTYKSKHSNEIYQIKKTFSCNSKMVVYLIQGRICSKQDNGSIVTKFCTRANSHKSTYRNFRKRQKKSKEAHNQIRFHEGYLPTDHNGIFDW